MSTRFPLAPLITALVKLYTPPVAPRPKLTSAEAVKAVRRYVEHPRGPLAQGEFETWQDAAVCLFHDTPHYDDDSFELLHDLRLVKGNEFHYKWTAFGKRVLASIEKSK